MFDLAIDSKLRGCDLVKLKIGDLVAGADIRNRATVVQRKTGRPVQFEIANDASSSLLAWLERREGAQSMITLSQAGLITRGILVPDNMRVWSMNGSLQSDCKDSNMGHILFDGPRHQSSIRLLVTFVRSKFF